MQYHVNLGGMSWLCAIQAAVVTEAICSPPLEWCVCVPYRLLFPGRRLQVQEPAIQRQYQQGLLLPSLPGLHRHCDSHSCASTVSCRDAQRQGRVQHQSQHSHHPRPSVSPSLCDKLVSPGRHSKRCMHAALATETALSSADATLITHELSLICLHVQPSHNQWSCLVGYVANVAQALM